MILAKVLTLTVSLYGIYPNFKNFRRILFNGSILKKVSNKICFKIKLKLTILLSW